MKANKPEDIWKHINRLESDDCWLFAGGTFSGRYGRFCVGQKAVLAHRVVYELCNGPAPSGAFVMHKCNVKLCCNPNHLTVGSNSENQRHASTSGAFDPGATGIRGVGRDKKRNYWTAQGYLRGKKHNLYTGPHLNKAIAARKRWESAVGISFTTKGK